MSLIRCTEEVFYSGDGLVRVSVGEIQELKALASHAKRRRSRLCAHPNVESPLHEMFIVHQKGTYVRPHKHLDRSESFHVVEGEIDVLVFSDDGILQHRIRMGDYGSGNVFYYRLTESLYHTVLIQSEVAVFHETTNGPFRPDRTAFSVWSPAQDDEEAVTKFMRSLDGMPSPRR